MNLLRTALAVVLAALAILALPGCATTGSVPQKQLIRGYEVQWDEDVREKPLWACLFDPEDGGRILCADYQKVLDMYLEMHPDVLKAPHTQELR